MQNGTNQKIIAAKSGLASVKPSECVLGLTIPLTREQFLSDLANPEKDYARHIKRKNFTHWRTDEDYWNTIYSPIAKRINRQCEDVRQYKVTVIRSLSLGVLNDLFKEFKVITLVSHWRFNKLRAEEISDPRGFIELLRSPQNLVQKKVGALLLPAFTLNGEDFTAGMDENVLREKLCNELNVTISKAHSFYRKVKNIAPTDPKAQGELLDRQPLERLTRYALEQGFSKHLAASRAIEFSDEMHSVPELVESIPSEYSGLLDLTVCNSVIVGEIIKFHRPECFVAVNRYPTQPHIRMALYKLAIAQLSQSPMSFIDAVTKIHTRR